jgi:hypothetical protein
VRSRGRAAARNGAGCSPSRATSPRVAARPEGRRGGGRHGGA